MSNMTVLPYCVACSYPILHPYADLGMQPLANDFYNTQASKERYPLKLNHCHLCDHSQLSHAVSPERLFRKYAYVSGTSQTMRSYFLDFVYKAERLFPNKKELFVLDIGCNDGSLLEEFRQRGHRVLGVDPSNIAYTAAITKQIEIINSFWNADVAEIIKQSHGHPDVVIGMNVVAHTPNPYEFMAACKSVVHPHGIIFLQTSQARMVQEGQFDTVYHEHISFFSPTSMERLVNRAGMVLTDIDIVDIHGDSFLFTIRTRSSGKLTWRYVNDLVREERLDRAEAVALYKSMSVYDSFGIKMLSTQISYSKAIDVYRCRGYKFYGYGAAAKGTVFANYVKHCPTTVIDESRSKHEGRIPGFPKSMIVYSSDIPWETIDTPIVFIVYAWNFVEEISTKIRMFRNNPKDRILVNFPVCQVMDLNLNSVEIDNDD